MGNRYRLAVVLLAVGSANLFGDEKLETRIFDVRRLVGWSATCQMEIASVGSSGSGTGADRQTRFLSPERLAEILEERASELPALRIIDGRAECIARPEQLGVIESTLYDLESALPHQLTVECLFVPAALATHPALADLQVRGHELKTLAGVSYLKRLTTYGVPVALSDERRISAHSDFDVEQAGAHRISPAVSEHVVGVCFSATPSLLPDSASVVLELAGRASTLALREVTIGEAYSPLQLPIIDEAVVSTRVRVPTGQYMGIARVGGAAGGIVIVRVAAPAATPFTDTRCRSYALGPLSPLPERAWPPTLDFEHAGVADDPVAEMRRRVRAELGIEDSNATELPAVWWTDESRLILHGKSEQHARIQARLQEFCERRFKNYKLTISRLVVPRSAIWEILGESGATCELNSTWQQALAGRARNSLDEHSVQTLAHTPVGIRSGRTRYYVSDFQTHGSTTFAYPADDPLVEPIEGGMFFTAILNLDPLRPDVVDLRFRGITRDDVVLQPQALEFPVFLAAGDSADLDYSVTFAMRVGIEIASASVEKWDLTRTLPLGRDVVVEMATDAESVRVLIVRVEEAP